MRMNFVNLRLELRTITIERNNIVEFGGPCLHISERNF